MTKRGILIVSGVLVLLLIIVAIVLYVLQGKQPVSVTTSTQFPIASSSPNLTATKGTISLTANNGATIQVPDFINAPGTVKEPYTPGEYVLADDCSLVSACTNASSAKGFRIVYDQQSQLFNVLLLAEPLGESRFNAEQFLINQLQVSYAQLCGIKATVGTINSVNATYAGEELGFSQCKNSVLLP